MFREILLPSSGNVLWEKYLSKRSRINPLSAKFIKWSNTLKQIVGKLPTICLSVFDHFSGLALQGLNILVHDVINLLYCFFMFLYQHESLFLSNCPDNFTLTNHIFTYFSNGSRPSKEITNNQLARQI